jgi:hypothetical protein
MIPSHLRWLETDAPDVLPSAARAHRMLVLFWLPVVALASCALLAAAVLWSGESDPVVLAGTVFIVAWFVVFLPPAIIAWPVAWGARRARRNAALSEASRRELSKLALLNFALVAFAPLALVPSLPYIVATMRHYFGGA